MVLNPFLFFSNENEKRKVSQLPKEKYLSTQKKNGKFFSSRENPRFSGSRKCFAFSRMGERQPFFLSLSGNSKKERVRKAQFFLMGAIVIVISLFTLTETLSRKADFDPASIQGNDISLTYINILDLLNQTAKASSNLERDNNIKHLAKTLQDELSPKKINLQISYSNANVLPLDINVILNSPEFTLNKTATFG